MRNFGIEPHEGQKSSKYPRYSIFNSMISQFSGSRTSRASSDAFSYLTVDSTPVELVEDIDRDKEIITMCSEKCLNKNIFTSVLTTVYAQRKVVFFFLLHFVMTMICWQHFMYNKFGVLRDDVPEGANRYWWKRMVPSLEFGTMHAILFQMALLPLTMCRYSLTRLSTTYLNRVIPFNHMIRMHIHLGYTMVIIVIAATITFFVFFGLLCEEQKKNIEPRPDGQFTFCDKFTTEIMSTGLGIVGALILVWGTSYFRDRIRYEHFYIVHHVVFILFGITIAHTFDDQFRQGLMRSQTYKWFSGPLLLYLTDRFYMWANMRTLPVLQCEALGNTSGPRAVILRLKKPVSLGFIPGQYVSLQIPCIDPHWHPYSIASSPNEHTLDFYIDVFDSKDSWTAKMWEYAKVCRQLDGVFTQKCNVLGPYGTSLDVSSHAHTCFIGAGTGIVPHISALKATINACVQINPDVHNSVVAEARELNKDFVIKPDEHSKSFRHLAKRALEPERPLQEEAMQTEYGIMNHNPSISKTRKTFESKYIHDLDPNASRLDILELLKSRIETIRRKELLKLCVLLLPVWEVMMIGLMISWNYTTTQPTVGMVDILRIGSICSNAAFALIWLVSFDAVSFMSWLDFLFLSVTTLTTVLWHFEWAKLNHLQIGAYVLLTLYRASREWLVATSCLNDRIREKVENTGRIPIFNMSSTRLVWVCRDAVLVEHLWKELDRYWCKLENSWGQVHARRAVKIKIYVTDTDVLKNKHLLAAVKKTQLYKTGALRFGRPSIHKIIENQLLKRLRDDLEAGGVAAGSSTLVAFCGSPQLGGVVGRTVMDYQIIADVMGHGHHTMTFYQENYGVSSRQSQTLGSAGVIAEAVEEEDDNDDDGYGDDHEGTFKGEYSDNMHDSSFVEKDGMVSISHVKNEYNQQKQKQFGRTDRRSDGGDSVIVSMSEIYGDRGSSLTEVNF